MKYQITNKTFSPIILNGIGAIPARGSVVTFSVSDGLRAMQKSNKVEIKEIREAASLKDKKSNKKN